MTKPLNVRIEETLRKSYVKNCTLDTVRDMTEAITAALMPEILVEIERAREEGRLSGMRVVTDFIKSIGGAA